MFLLSVMAHILPAWGSRLFISLLLLLLTPVWNAALSQPASQTQTLFLPMQWRGNPSVLGPMIELRGLWVNRFDWTTLGRAADPAKIDEIVTNAADAGFNVIFFQVRGVADAYYAPGLEPWAQRVSGQTLGKAPEPYWDPLAYLIAKAHERGLQVHAYFNVYPVAQGGDFCAEEPDPLAQPQPLYHQLAQQHGVTEGKVNGLQWRQGGQVLCGQYREMSPASRFGQNHIIRVALDIVWRYDVDGVHLDRVRYAAANASCDPVSLCRYHGLSENCDPVPACALDETYRDWQRQQVSEFVHRLSMKLKAVKPDLWISAAVLPVYRDEPALQLPGHPQEAYNDAYQDSKGWLSQGYVDAIMPLIYPAVFRCPDDSYWTLDIWRRLTADYLADAGEGAVIPGIGAGYCTFDEIEARIAAARELGAIGHAIFSYRGLLNNGYFDDLRWGPYRVPAAPPQPPSVENSEPMISPWFDAHDGARVDAQKATR
ncbi:MAG: family 10 glycosylhydrolase [Chloroflexi bacterium]|nr:family 10 glycosylhydrolase [Chloroflexota bacterium]